MLLTVRDLDVEVPGRRLVQDVNLEADRAEFVAILGTSGSGKTTLLNTLAGIAVPARGEVRIDDVAVHDLPARRRALFRLQKIGLVFQFAELLPELSALENVTMPLRFVGVDRKEAGERAMEWLAKLGVADKAAEHPDSLSGGEQQRVGIARAVVKNPLLILADEPTGMLDEATTATVVEALVDAARSVGSALVVATHDRDVAGAADTVLAVRDARLQRSEVPHGDAISG